MSATARMRAIVAVIAVAAAAVVAGVVYATRQDPAQPKARCKRAAAFVVPGVASPHVAAVRRALAQAGVCRRPASSSRSPNEHPAIPSSSTTRRRRCSARGFVNEATVAFRKAKKDGRDTQYEVASGQHPSPAVLHGRLPAVRVPRSRCAARPGPDRAAELPPADRRAALGARREVAPERSGRAGRGRGRTVRHGRSFRLVLAARPARRAVPEAARR